MFEGIYVGVGECIAVPVSERSFSCQWLCLYGSESSPPSAFGRHSSPPVTQGCICGRLCTMLCPSSWSSYPRIDVIIVASLLEYWRNPASSSSALAISFKLKVAALGCPPHWLPPYGWIFVPLIEMVHLSVRSTKGMYLRNGRPTLLASDAVEVVHDVGTCVMVDVVIRDVIREYLLSSGCRRGYKGVDPRTLLVWALSLRGLV